MKDGDLFEHVQHLIRQGQVLAALPFAQQWTAQQPQEPRAWAQLGQVFVLLQQTQPAQQALEKALSLDPRLTTAVVAMAAVCLDQGNDPRAIELLQQAMSDPQLPWVMWLRSAHHMVQAMVRCGQVDQARRLLAMVQEKLRTTGAAAPDWLAACQWRLAPGWWGTRQTSRIRLRRALPDDAAWLKQAFADPAFGDAVNRDYAQRMQKTELSQLASQLAQQHRVPPADQGAMIWLIERHDKQPAQIIGLASFTNIDSHSLRAEFIIGFPGGQPSGGLVLEASALLAEFAFGKEGARFHKVCASVYADNPRVKSLLRMLNQVGFQQEGLLREQVKLHAGQFVDLIVLGGLRTDVIASTTMRQIAHRYLGHEL